MSPPLTCGDSAPELMSENSHVPHVGQTRPESGAAEAVSYRTMRRRDVPAAARLHQVVFADHFLGHMDRRFLELFYAQFLPGERGTYSVVAIADGRVVGSVIGSTDLGGLYGRFYRRHFFELAARVGRSAIRDRWVRRHLMERVPHILTAVRSKILRGRTAPPDSAVWPPAQLLSIGVSPRLRGTPVATRLTAEFCGRLAEDGVAAVGLTVLRDNGRAIRFYEKTGWTPGRSNDQALTFWRLLPIPPDGAVTNDAVTGRAEGPRSE